MTATLVRRNTAKQKPYTLIPADVIKLFTASKDVISDRYHQHIKPFTGKEVALLLMGHEGQTLKVGRVEVTRLHQLRQVVSCIGASLADQGKLDEASAQVYKALWAIDREQTCKYCAKPFITKLMFGSPTYCNKAKCVRSAMVDHM